jgi:uncharacterized cupin superfamily protein
MNKPILNISDIEFAGFPVPPTGHAAEVFAGKLGDIGRRMGAQKLGANITVLPPGKCVFPFHNHHVNEEMFYILEGSGELRMGSETFPVVVGDFVLCPPGGKEVAHQIKNTGTADMKYLAISTKESPEIAEYPDSGKFGVMTKDVRFIGKLDQSMDYWAGE